MNKDEAFANCISRVKEQTGLFRKALESWIERALEAEQKVEELEEKVEDLTMQVDSLIDYSELPL
jgi:archaellum component FlaC